MAAAKDFFQKIGSLRGTALRLTGSIGAKLRALFRRTDKGRANAASASPESGEWLEVEEGAAPAEDTGSAAASGRPTALSSLRGILRSKHAMLVATVLGGLCIFIIGIVSFLGRPLPATRPLSAGLDLELLSEMEIPAQPIPFAEARPLRSAGMLPAAAEVSLWETHGSPELIAALAEKGRALVESLLEEVE